ncbi:hypothetical protein H0H81_002861 [Sphagnurus paluster]|uniref:Clavaminate synthase-like protein n=1 Tax=Sphagnurus paluster TaxID=117069 RepID=A0A9P7KJS2_9AGAR|nr:hypothetical protein H0H81_002861 [Sphagnurus paluster]
MSPAKVNALPIIDIAPFLNQNSRNADLRASTAAALHKACVEYGFFYLDISAYVDPAVPERLTTLGREFFSLPSEEKEKIALKNQDYARGYQRLKENVTNGKADNHDGIDFYKPVEKPDKTRPLWGENQWPTVPEFKDRYEEWVEKMKALGLIVMEAYEPGLGMTPEEWAGLRAQVDDSFWVMRVIGYPPLPNDDDGFSCGAHKFLHADPTPSALQVFSSRPGAIALADTSMATQVGSEKGVWINADPIPGCVVCNIGESKLNIVTSSETLLSTSCVVWEIWTNGLYRSTLHQVVHRGSNYRYVSCVTMPLVLADLYDQCLVCISSVKRITLWVSDCIFRIPFFFEPNFDAEVKPLTAALRLQEPEDRKECRNSVVYGEFLMAKVGNNFAGGKGKYN